MRRTRAQIIADLTAAAKVRVLPKDEVAQLEYAQRAGPSHLPKYKPRGSARRLKGAGARRSPTGELDILDQLARMTREELEGVRTALTGSADDRAPVALRVVEAEIWARGQTAKGWCRSHFNRFTIISGARFGERLAT